MFVSSIAPSNCVQQAITTVDWDESPSQDKQLTQ